MGAGVCCQGVVELWVKPLGPEGGGKILAFNVSERREYVTLQKGDVITNGGAKNIKPRERKRGDRTT